MKCAFSFHSMCDGAFLTTFSFLLLQASILLTPATFFALGSCTGPTLGTFIFMEPHLSVYKREWSADWLGGLSVSNAERFSRVNIWLKLRGGYIQCSPGDSGPRCKQELCKRTDFHSCFHCFCLHFLRLHAAFFPLREACWESWISLSFTPSPSVQTSFPVYKTGRDSPKSAQ